MTASQEFFTEAVLRLAPAIAARRQHNPRGFAEEAIRLAEELTNAWRRHLDSCALDFSPLPERTREKELPF